MPIAFDVVSFDLDGTLADTAPDLAASLNHVLGELGRPTLAREIVRHLVGHGARALIHKGLAVTGEASEELVEQGYPLFMDYYGANICNGTIAFHGVEAALDDLASLGIRAAVCTNKPKRLTDLLIDALGWGDRFDAVLGADSLPVRKPDPLHLTSTIEAAGGHASDAAYVGDSITDALTAQAAGIPLVLVTFGYSVDPVEQLGADVLIDSFARLPEALAAFKTRSMGKG